MSTKTIKFKDNECITITIYKNSTAGITIYLGDTRILGIKLLEKPLLLAERKVKLVDIKHAIDTTRLLKHLGVNDE